MDWSIWLALACTITGLLLLFFFPAPPPRTASIEGVVHHVEQGYPSKALITVELDVVSFTHNLTAGSQHLRGRFREYNKRMQWVAD